MAEPIHSIDEKQARQLSNTTKTPPQWRGATPRWLAQFLPWTSTEAGVYRLNQALDDDFAAHCSPFFVAHPRAIAAFGRECTRRGVPPPTMNLFGSPFLTWRGLPLVPNDKIPFKDKKTSILCMRTGERKRGVIGLFQPGIPGEVSP